MKYATRKDQNHAEVGDYLRAYGWATMDTSMFLGIGCDYMAVRGDKLLFIEVKRDSKAKLTAAEERLRLFAPQHWRRVETLEDVKQL